MYGGGGGMYGGGGGMYGQQGMMQHSQPGMPGQQPQDMAPQFNFRTTIRFVMELAAIIQGCSLIGMMAGGWAQEMGSNEEQPLRKFGLWVGGALKGMIGSLLPFLGTRRR